MRRTTITTLALSLSTFTFTVACSSSSDSNANPADTSVSTDGGSDASADGGVSLLEIACTDSVADTYVAPASITGAKGTMGGDPLTV